MQYLLSQEEYDDLTKKPEYVLPISVDELQELCTQIADTMPIKVTDLWGKESKEAHTWGCIITQGYDHYCDECPVQKICPKPYKIWSQ